MTRKNAWKLPVPVLAMLALAALLTPLLVRDAAPGAAQTVATTAFVDEAFTSPLEAGASGSGSGNAITVGSYPFTLGTNTLTFEFSGGTGSSSQTGYYTGDFGSFRSGSPTTVTLGGTEYTIAGIERTSAGVVQLVTTPAGSASHFNNVTITIGTTTLNLNDATETTPPGGRVHAWSSSGLAASVFTTNFDMALTWPGTPTATCAIGTAFANPSSDPADFATTSGSTFRFNGGTGGSVLSSRAGYYQGATQSSHRDSGLPTIELGGTEYTIRGVTVGGTPPNLELTMAPVHTAAHFSGVSITVGTATLAFSDANANDLSTSTLFTWSSPGLTTSDMLGNFDVSFSTGRADLSSDFAAAVNGSACDVTYTGTGLQNPDGTQAAVSVAVTLTDSVGSGVDDTVNATVVLVGLGTDRLQLDAFHTNTAGVAWTNKRGWAEQSVGTFSLTAGANDDGTRTGYDAAAELGSGSATITLNNTTYTVRQLVRDTDTSSVRLAVSPVANAATDFAGLSLRLGSTEFLFDSASTGTFGGVHYWDFAIAASDVPAPPQPGDPAPQQPAPDPQQPVPDQQQPPPRETPEVPGEGSVVTPTVAALSGTVNVELFYAAPTDLTPVTSSWHGVTVPPAPGPGEDPAPGNQRVTGLDLSNNGLAHSAVTLPAGVGLLSELRSLDLSDNPGLRGEIPAAWTALTKLTTLDLSGTGVCVDPEDTRIKNWLATIANSTVSTCGTDFPADAVTLLLDAGSDGSGTAIAVGAPAFTASLYSAGATACDIDAQGSNASDDPADHSTATAVTHFTINASTCALSYTGDATSSGRTAGTREAFSLTLSINDGRGPGNTASTATDDTIAVTVKLVDSSTDDEVLDAFHTATTGASWTMGGSGTGQWTGTLSGSWHGVTLDSNNRVTALALSNNNLNGAIPAGLAELNKLTSLDLSDNASLTLTAPGTGLTGLAGLTTLDISGTGICENTTDAEEPLELALNAWLGGLRMGSATVTVTDCAAGAPAFAQGAITFTLDSGADGSGMGNAIAIGTPSFTASTVTGATDTCEIASQAPTADDAVFVSERTELAHFSIDSTTCAITYTGGATDSVRVPGTLEGWSLLVTLSDGVDAGGQTDMSVDSTIRVTVKVLGVDTDREALAAFYTAAGGSGWTTNTRWNSDYVLDMMQVSGAINTTSMTAGYRHVLGATNPEQGRWLQVPDSPATPTFEVMGTTYTLRGAQTSLQDRTTFTLTVSPAGSSWSVSDFASLQVRIGVPGRLTQENPQSPLVQQSATLSFDDAAGAVVVTEHGSELTFTWAAGGPPLATMRGNIVVAFLRPLSSWHGVSQDADGRVTEIDLSGDFTGNNLSGTMPPAAVGELSRLTRLDLSYNANMRGTVPDAWTALANLTHLDLGHTGLCADATDTAVNAWTAGIASPMGNYVRVQSCGPSFPDSALTLPLDSGSDGSTTPVAVGAPAFRAGLHVGATDTCELTGAQANDSDDPADHFGALTSAMASDLAIWNVDGATCAISYEGAAAARSAGSLEAFSLRLTITDGRGASTADDTIDVTVRLVNADTDIEVLDALYTATTGASWTASTGWSAGAALAGRLGVTLDQTSGRVTGLALPANNLAGAVPEALADLNKLTSLDLSGNPSLTLSWPTHGLTRHTALTSLNAVGSGFCENSMLALNRLLPTELAIRVWLQGLRGQGAVVSVTDCASGGPRFADAALTFTLDAGSDGSGTAIVVGAPVFAGGTAPNGTDACAIQSQVATGDTDAFTASGTQVTLFTIDSGTCAISYEGAAAASARTAGTLEGWSLRLALTDGVDGGGTANAATDSTIDLTVKLVNGDTDREALTAIYEATNGASWTDPGGWADLILQTFPLTGGTGAFGSVGFLGSVGSLRNNHPGTVTLGATEYTLEQFYVGSGNVLYVTMSPAGQNSDFSGIQARVGTTSVALDNWSVDTSADDRTHESYNYMVSLSGDFDVEFIRPQVSATGSWGGVTVTSGRVTQLDLSGNNLSGPLPAALAELSALTDLDLSDNSGLTGNLPASLGNLKALTSLNTSGTGLSGALPAGIGGLAAITDLDLSGASLSGPIPAGLTTLTTLTTLDLSDNELSGELPAALDSLTALTALNLGGNGFTGAIPSLASLAALTDLDLGYNVGLTGGIPASLGSIGTQLTSLDLGGSSGLGGTIPTALSTLTGLTALDLSNAGLTGEIPTELSALVNLTRLDLSGNAQLGGLVPPSLNALAAMLEFDLRNTLICLIATEETVINSWITTQSAMSGADFNVPACDLTGTNNLGPSFTAEAITYLLDAGVSGASTPVAIHTAPFTAGTAPGGVDACGLSAAWENDSDDPNSFHEATATGETDAQASFNVVINDDGDACAITYTGSGATRTSGTLEAYSLSVTVGDAVNDAGGPDRRSDSTFKVTVKIVDLSTDQEALEALATATGRTTAWTNGGSGTGEWTGTVSSTWYGVTVASSRVTGLNLNNNGLTGGPVPALLGELTQLTSLNLGRNSGITGGIPAELGELTSLTSLDLSEGGWTGNIPAALGNLGSLTTLDLSGNGGLRGSVPAALGQLASLTALRLHNNDGMSGPIPAELGGLTSLTGLTLYNSGVTGTIPEELRQLTALTSLLLNDNAGLTGSIPGVLDEMAALTHLSLSGTGVCVDPPGQQRVETWLNSFRGTMNGGAFVPTCDPLSDGSRRMAPSFAAAAASYRLDAGEDGSSTPIVLGTITFTRGTYSGATTNCRLVSAIENPDADGAFLDSGTDASGDITVTPASLGTACVVSYTGSGATRTAGTLEAYSIKVATHDGVDDTGAVDTTTDDDTIDVTVRLLDAETDRAALEALFGEAGGSGWTTRTGWTATFTVDHTFALTAATAVNFVGYSPLTGAVRNSSGSVTLGGNTYTLTDLLRFTNGSLRFSVSGNNARTNGQTDFAGKSLRFGDRVYTFASGALQSNPTRYDVRWSNTPAGLILIGDFDVELGVHTPQAALSMWHGVTVDGTTGRVTALALTDNGLRGRIPASLGDLSKLTSLDLSANQRLSGTVPETLAQAPMLATVNLENTRVARGATRATNDWLAGIGTFTPGTAPSGAGVAPPPVVTVNVAARGATAPAGAMYGLTLSCGAYEFMISLPTGGSYSTEVGRGENCSLAATERRGATRVSGEFQFRAITGSTGVTVTFTHPAAPSGGTGAPPAGTGAPPTDSGTTDDPADEDPATEDPADEEPVDEALAAAVADLDEDLVIGSAFVAWSGESTPVAEAVEDLTLRVTAVYWWDSTAQRWLSWFPNAEGLGVNTLATLENRGIYGVFASERPREENGG